MVLTMVRPYRHAKTGMFWMRKVVPSDLRAIVGRVELKESLKTKDPAEAKAASGPVRDRFDAVIASARARKRGEASAMSARQIAAIVGSWYRAEAAERADDPGDAVSWEARGHYLDGLFESASEDRHAPIEFHPDPHIVRDTEDRLRADGFVPNRETLIRVAERWADAQMRLAVVMEARAKGDWTPDPNSRGSPSLPNAIAALWPPRCP